MSAVMAKIVCLSIAIGISLQDTWEASAQESTENTPEVARLGPNRDDEPFASSFSLDRAAAFTDLAAATWQTEYNCVTCHTNGLYLIAGARPNGGNSTYANARQFADDYLKQYVLDSRPVRGQRGSVEGIVATTAYLAISDMKVQGELADSTRQYFDHIWTLQNESGCWDWLKCNWPPFEVDDHYGATLVALACGMIGVVEQETDESIRGIQRLRKYLADTPPANLHQKAMMLWAGSSFDGIVDSEKRAQWIAEIGEAQHDDGGWSTAELGSGMWKRPDGGPQGVGSDAYATALAVYALNQTGVALDDRRLQRGLEWLKSNQRKSGRWYVRSLRSDNKHFISHAATNMALLALSLEED